MVLSGKEIIARQGQDIEIVPFNIAQVNPCSYNLRLNNELLVYEDSVLDMKRDNPCKRIQIPDSGLCLEPFKLYLGRTVEYTRTDKYLPIIEGRSSVARLGMCIHITAGFGDAGFAGYWTLEMYCVNPVIIYPYVEICQIYYFTVEGEYDKYCKKYNNNDDVEPSKLYEDFK